VSRPPAADRARRVMAMIPWVVAQGGATVEEIAEQFGVPPAVVERDLERASCYQAGANGWMVAVWVDEGGVVRLQPGGYFDRPRRLTPLQAVAILAAVDALDFDQPTALDSLRTKLQQTLRARPGGLAVAVDEPPYLDAVRDAIARRERVRVRYYSAWRDEVGERDIDPHRVVAFGSAWQLFAWCLDAGDWRHFRVDRIEALHPTGEAAEDYPHEIVERRADGGLRIALQVVGEVWLERLLLRLGPGAIVVEPQHLRTLQRDAARRLLSRYARG